MSGAALGLARGVSVDLWDFQALAYRLLVPGTSYSSTGSLVDDLAGLSADVLPDWYEDWATAEAEDWRQLRLHALEALSGMLTDQGLYGAAILAALSAIRVDDLRESSRAALIKAHLAEGNTSEASASSPATGACWLGSFKSSPRPV